MSEESLSRTEPDPAVGESAAPAKPLGSYPDLGGAFTPLYRRLTELGVAGRIVGIGKIGPRGRSADFAVDDPGQFLDALRSSERCCTDTRVGRILHPGKISVREDRTSNSLHVAMNADGKVLAHLDRLSPLRPGGCGQTCRYSPLRVLAHNAARLWGDLFRYLFGHRLDCAPLLLSLKQAQATGRELREAGAGETPPHPGAPDDVDRVPLIAVPETEIETAGRPRQSVPFNVIDEAVHVLDTPVEPWSVHLEVRVAGTLDEQRLRVALQQAFGRHPLARVRKTPAHPSARNFQWEIGQRADVDPLRIAFCGGAVELAAIRSRFISQTVPLGESPPVRVCLVHDPAGDVLLLNVNHAASDPIGSLRLLHSVARAYAGTADTLPDVDPLAVRDVAELLRARDVPTELRRFALLAEKARDLVAVPVRVAPDKGVDKAGYGIHLVQPTKELTDTLLPAASSKAVNDALMAALHLAIALWNIEHGVPCGRISVLMPVNLRPRAWHDQVMGNFSLLVRVLTTPEQRSLGHVLGAVAAQTERMKQEDTFGALIEVLARTASLPIWAKRAAPALLAVTGNRLVDTAELYFLGDLDRLPTFGPAAGQTLGLWFSPPARMPLGLSVGALTAGGGLHLAFRYRHPLFSEAAAARFADYYLGLLAHLLRAQRLTP